MYLCESRSHCCFSDVRQAVEPSAEELRGKWILQDSSTSPCESTITYAPVDAVVLQPVVYGDDSSAVAVLPCCRAASW